MSQKYLVAFDKDTKKLVEESVFIPKTLKEKVLKKLNDQNLSGVMKSKIKSLLVKIIKEEESIIRKVLEKSPMFFKDLEYKHSRELLMKKNSSEESIKSEELREMEEELNKFLDS